MPGNLQSSWGPTRRQRGLFVADKPITSLPISIQLPPGGDHPIDRFDFNGGCGLELVGYEYRAPGLGNSPYPPSTPRARVPSLSARGIGNGLSPIGLGKAQVSRSSPSSKSPIHISISTEPSPLHNPTQHYLLPLGPKPSITIMLGVRTLYQHRLPPQPSYQGFVSSNLAP
jgi:hypothetical protein